MIQLSNVAKHFGDQTLFEGVSIQFNPGERYGIVGANGCGKSTLLKILAGDETASEGDVTRPRNSTLGVLKQDHFQYEENRILDVVMMGNSLLWDAMHEKEQILAKSEVHFDGDRYAELEDLIVQNGGYTLEARAGEILEGLGIASEVHEQTLSTLSGGFKLRVLLAQVLASEPDVLLLDEPTNHLDILSIRWLERFLVEFPGAALLVSHDHRFLDNVSTIIVDVDYQTVKAYPGNYQHFMRAKVEDRERKEKEIAKREAKIAEQKAFVERFRAKATKARQAQSKLKAIDRIDIEELPQSTRRYPHFRFQQQRPSGRQVLEVEGISKAYDDNHVLEDVSLTVQRGERIAIIGANGIGKSTLLKVCMAEVAADAGSVKWGYETHPGYVAQDHKGQLGNPRATLEGWLGNVAPGESIGFVRGHLGAVLFSGDEAEKKVGALSGGEAARLVFAKHVIEQPNVLILDEPTNHLDLEAIESLVKGLQGYEGTLIFVSHDRWFVGELATRIVELTRAGINDFSGTYAEYLEKCGDDHLDAQVVLQKAREKKREKPGKKKVRRGPDPKKERRKLAEELEGVTAELQQAEAKLDAINERFADPNFYEATPHDERTTLEADHRAFSESVAALMERWESLETRIGQCDAANDESDSRT